jgi:ABC-type transport system involved in multi-copper enzyme maturation permease subunit
MSPLVKKEIRLVLPAWILAMLLAIVPAWVAGTAWNMDNSTNRAEAGFWLEGLVPCIFALGLLLLGLSPFGQEFSQGTFTVLLSQPAGRSRIWWTKITLAATAFSTVWLAALVSLWFQYYLYDHFHPIDSLHPFRELYFNHQYQRFSASLDNSLIFLTLAVLVVFSGGLWTTLLLRQITNAFWFTLLTPIVIIFGIMSILSDRIASGYDASLIIVVALAIYSVAGFCAAAFLFRRCQDVQSAGGDVSLPSFKKSAGLGTTSLSFRPRNRFLALVWKEIQLHQVNILISALVLLLHLGSFFVRKIHPHFINPSVPMVLEIMWVLWLLMPILIGSSAIADERRLGIIESQLSLPVSRRMQLFIKFFVAFILSLFLGAAFPLLIEGTKNLDAWLIVIAGGLFFISFYASSMSRTVLQAMGLAIVIGTALFFYQIKTVLNFLEYTSSHAGPGYYMYQGEYGLDLLRVFPGTAILLLALTGLTYWNYKRLRQNNAMVLANLVAMIVAFAAIPILTYAIYFRAWEYVTPTWPPRGPTRLSHATGVKLAGSPGAIYAVLPDGRLSVQMRAYRPFLNGFGVSVKAHAANVPGTNWIQAAADPFQAVGIRSDGSLWSIQRQWDASHGWFQQKSPFILSQIGSETNWSQAAAGHHGFLLLKNDGSLWTWGTYGFDWTHFQSSIPSKLRADLATRPVRLSDETNWTQLFSSSVSAFVMNDYGDVWSWLPWIGTNYVSRFERDGSANGPWRSFVPGENVGQYIGVKTDGTLWLKNQIILNGTDKASSDQLGEGDKKWKAATFSYWDHILAIRSDGTLWNCQDLTGPVQLGTHSDWIALSPGGLSLAADGSLWAWDQPSWHIWLAPPRKPAYMGNIFQGSTANP